MKINLAIVVALAAVFLTGCDLPVTEYSKMLTESGEVYDVAYVPRGHGSDTAIGFNTGKGGGMTVTPVSVTIPERYAVVFKCEHGKFVITGDKAKALYYRLERGQRVSIYYRIIYKVTKKGGRVQTDLDFIDAFPAPTKADK